MLIRLFTFALIMLLTGCSTTEPQRSNVNWQAERSRLEKLNQWQLTGKMAIIMPGQKGSARLNWQQQGPDYHLQLSSLIGTHILDIERKQGVITLIDNEGQRHQSQDAQMLVYQLTGWNIPLQGLVDWIKGLPGQAQYQLNPDNSLAQVQDGQWQIIYGDYRDQQGYRLPHLLTMQGQGSRLKLQINQWSLHQP